MLEGKEARAQKLNDLIETGKQKGMLSYKEIMDSIRKKLFLLPDDTNVFPGHMGTTSIGFEKENNPFV